MADTAPQDNTAGLLRGTSGGNVEVDSHDPLASDAESSEYSTATTSIASSVFSFTYANGRRYHSGRFKNEYFMPNDEKEQERLDLYHHIFLMILGGKLVTAPLDNPQRVLDVGTGTGIWAIDFADENPQAKVTAVDLSPIQPNWVPPNCEFEIDDLEQIPWTFKDDQFDYIHIRSMGGSMKNWPEFFKEAYNKTTPGGYVEVQDYSPQPFLCDGTMLTGEQPEHPLSTYMHHVMQASSNRGYLLDMAPQADKFLEEAGFVDIVQKKAIWPVGHWPKDKHLKDLGRYCRLGSEQSAFPFAVALLKGEGWTMPQIQTLCDDVVESYQQMGQPGTAGKYYFQAWFTYGRKPE